MAIKLLNPVVPEVLTYDTVSITSMELVQQEGTDATVQNKYDLIVHYKLYAIDSANKKHFDSARYTFTVYDYLAVAQTKKAAGDNTMLTTIKAIEQMIALLINDKNQVGTTEAV